MKYPKIPRWESVENKDLFHGNIVITEKLDGSQIIFGKVDGELIINSKHKNLLGGPADKKFKTAINVIQEREDVLLDGVIYYGEYLSTPKHNRLCYTNTPKNHIALFAFRDGFGIESNPEDVLRHAMSLELDTVPVLEFNTNVYVITTLEEQLKKLIDSESYLGGCNMEGCVIQNLDNNLKGKYVSDEFKEIAVLNKLKKHNQSPTNKIEEYIKTFKTTSRWLKAVTTLEEKDCLVYNNSDIGVLCHTVQNDIEEEEKEDIKEWLYTHYRKNIFKEATFGLAGWYTDYLRLYKEYDNDTQNTP